MSEEEFRERLISVLNSLKSGITANNVRAEVESLKGMKISQYKKTKIFRELVKSGNYIGEIPKLSYMMAGKRKTHRKRKTHSKRKTHRNRK